MTWANSLQKPLTYEELFKSIQANKFPEYLKHWDNFANTETIPDVKSSEDCTDLCAKNEKCLQSKFDGWECKLEMNVFLMGVRKMPEDSKTYESHWNTTRIAQWVKNRKPCGNVEFPYQ
jgi:hypothetical protein